MRWLKVLCVTFGLLSPLVFIEEAGATPNLYVVAPSGDTGYIYAQSPGANVICANSVTANATTSVTAYRANGSLAGQVIDAVANGQATCLNIAGAVEWVYGKVEKKSRPYCYRRYKAVRQSTNDANDYFARWFFSSSASQC